MSQPDPAPEAPTAEAKPETVEVECLKSCWTSEASLPYLPAGKETRAEQRRKIEAGKAYTLHRDDAKMLHAKGFVRLAWKD